MEYRAYIDRLVNDEYLPIIQRGLEYINFADMLPRPDAKLYIKPNLTFPEYKEGVMTSVPAVKAAILALKEYTPNLYIGDSDSGGYNPFSMHEVYKQTGLDVFAEEHGVHVINVSDGPRRPLHFRFAGRKFALDLPTLLTDEIDMTITMPVPKIHMNTGVSLSFKNQWGCIPEPQDRLKMHPFLRHVLVEVNRAIKTQVVIMDGRWGLTRSGPMRGDPVRLDWVMVGNHIGVGARMGCELMQVDLNKVRHLRYAKKFDLIPELKDIQLNQPYEQFLTKDKFYLTHEWTDWPGLLAFNNSFLAYIAYFSPLSDILHKLLYLFREPFYDYDKYVAQREELIEERSVNENRARNRSQKKK